MLLNRGIFHKFDEELSLGNHVLVGLHYQRAPTTLKVKLKCVTFERFIFVMLLINLHVYITKNKISLTENLCQYYIFKIRFLIKLIFFK